MLTCLTPALYTDTQGREIDWSDPAVGLHGQTKSGEVVKVVVPKDCMILQIGEAMEVLTGGVIKALPHAVVPYKGKSTISRNSMALFIDPTH
jgi:isopenicillin N synthase-like dioxygenase